MAAPHPRGVVTEDAPEAVTGLPRFEVVARHRPIAVVADPHVTRGYDDTAALPLPAPFGAISAEVADAAARLRLALTGPDGARLSATLEDGRVSLSVDDATRRSRRHGRARRPTRFALTLTGDHLCALALEEDRWVVRGRIDLTAGDLGVRVPDVHDPAWLAGLAASRESTAAGPWEAGPFGQLGLRDLRLVTHADGTAYRSDGGTVLLTATSAGPGFFGTAHTSVWALRGTEALTHRGDLFFTRPERPGVWGDHATHLVRDGDRWLVATSTWADFPTDKRERKDARVRVTLAESTDDLTRGAHVLTARALELPTDGASVGVWDPHLARTEAGDWLVGYVSARKFFDFHPVLSSGTDLDALTLRGAARDRTATEGTTLLRSGDHWWVLASDGPDSARALRRRQPVFNLDMTEVGALAAPYPTNIPWPTVVPPAPDEPGGRWRLVTFNGRSTGGPLAGYGTHGDVVVMRAVD